MLERRDALGAVEQRGVVGALSLHGVESGHVLRHQHVAEPAVRHQLRLLERTAAPAQPLLLAAPDLGAFQECVDETIKGQPLREQPTPEGGVQLLWPCDPVWTASRPALPPVLLADGHHRLEAARRRLRGAPRTAADRLPALVVDHRHFPLTLSATHRAVPGLDLGRAVAAAGRIAHVTELPSAARLAPRSGTFLLTGAGRVWEVSEVSPTAMAGRLRFVPPEWVELPAAISDHVLIPALCEDQGVPPAPRYTSHPPGPDEVGLILPPPTWDQIWSGTASGAGMPPKSTHLGPRPTFWPLG
ncbi:DUF1015 family protein [Streptomyces hainanensis]|uniref:DUF1015 family protein n=1 Tax=Streptomyces hainanensis TaxID=402648 RepID=UPI0014045A4E|nr:DUF1015 family protein [Streptomyces hainanensis]